LYVYGIDEKAILEKAYQLQKEVDSYRLRFPKIIRVRDDK